MSKALIFALFALPAFAQVPHVNWEHHPVHGMDISADGQLLAVAHTADARVQLFDVSEGRPVPVGHVRVGLDPVSVRFDPDGRLWAVNHLSDSISVIDPDSRTVVAELRTGDEPADVVFARGRAFVSCSQINQVWVFDLSSLAADPIRIEIAGEDPRALAVSADGREVYAAIFESGNATTILGGGIAVDDTLAFPPNVTRDLDTPYAGQSPPPNSGDEFVPAMAPELPPPPQVGHIVRRDVNGRWMDDNGGDWTGVVSGPAAAQSGRLPGWDLGDRDLAIIDSQSLGVRYARGLMNINMGLAVHPSSGEVTVIGTDATNEVRFEPVLNGRFLRVNLARVRPDTGALLGLRDLNPHLDYSSASIAPAQRNRSLGDPRAIAWRSDGQQGFVAGMGSNNVVRIDRAGNRVGDPLAVGEGPVAMAIDESRDRLYVWNHFELSLSVVDTRAFSELERVAVFNPLPPAIREGRPLLYDTHSTSGLGHVSCASCHIDGRVDRLAWDLGDPSGEMKAFNQNCVTDLDPDGPCEDFHPMKGPMMTQTLQDIVGNEPFHWRGDRDGIEEFNGAFVSLLGDDKLLSDAEMQAFEDFLATLVFPPNPFRNFDNSLPETLELKGHFTTGRFAPAGQPLGIGDARRGLELYTTGLLDEPFQCSSCHTLPTGMAVNAPLRFGVLGVDAGGEVMETGPHGENHLGVVSVDGSTNRAIKVPQLRNMYEKTGFELTQTDNLAGFGFLHDGSVDSLARFVAEPAFELDSDRDVADLVALMLAFSGSDFGDDPTLLNAPPPPSKDAHAAVGARLVLTGEVPPDQVAQALDLADAGKVDLVASRGQAGWAYSKGRFVPGGGTAPLSLQQLNARASTAAPIVLTVVPVGLGPRFGGDRDGDGVADAAELAQGSNPADAASSTLQPAPGLWFNPARSGHGFDLQRLGDFLFITWYTYEDDGSPTWYQASAAFSGSAWSADLNRFTWNPDTGFVDTELAGTAALEFSDASHARFSWQIGDRPGSEPFQRLAASDAPTLRNYTGTWYDESEPGWGVTLYAEGDVRVAVLYFYDADNQPRWVLGQTSNAPAVDTPMLSFSGFCPDCARTEPVSQPGGMLQLQFSALDRAVLSSTAFYPGLAGSQWPRDGISIIPLSTPVTDFDQF